MSHIAETMSIYFETSSNKLKELDKYLDVMATQGYSNSDTNSYKTKYKQNIQQLKLLFSTFK